MKHKVGILGGTFDPPHLAHLRMAEEAKKQLGLEKVLFLPNKIPPHKQISGMASSEARLEMLQLMIEDNDYFEVDPRELGRVGKSYTYDTMRDMISEQPDTDFYFIIGGDMVEYLPKWYHIDDLVKMVIFVGVNRPSYQAEVSCEVIQLTMPEMHISSTEIRHDIENAEFFLPEKVWSYIKEHQLYGKK
ncbi:nicotinate-nucleotide adenylyltransferase [Listeria ivanovii]|uniref:nicotinate-nucleotide adenylyltransferase n=1 Tax=Listeria ivanovii TaxID=1638 RepID=UPI0019094536|nr:nicotinate-nucleotide adenylyltransferase [Listeria ivanovii]MBK3914414.1 nicotinate-nucleotide adenylyltransferase [Listeria ivanovii subsp. ivanovii]MBK3921687.1 nicotinate-nucleotide adenylyltransferase [Listeria ivanovii subsp. ivanovii]MBK3926851.1 nicotinate-nucleotide adenylyltransferase [Listeria ivanovii subsp. ivanovii]